MKTEFTLLTSLLIFTHVMQAHPTGHYHGFLETINHIFTQAGHSHWLAIVAGIATGGCFLRIAFATK